MEIEIGRKVLETNDRIADQNRRVFDVLGAFVVNLMSAPGSGKTSLLERTLAAVDGTLRTAVIEGDVRGSLDADRLARFELPIVQINTDPLFGGECHLDAPMVPDGSSGFPAVVRPRRHRERRQPGLPGGVPRRGGSQGDGALRRRRRRQAAQVSLDVPGVRVAAAQQDRSPPSRRLRRRALSRQRRAVNPRLEVIETSARTGEGIDRWIDWLRAESAKPRAGGAHVGRPERFDRPSSGLGRGLGGLARLALAGAWRLAPRLSALLRCDDCVARLPERYLMRVAQRSKRFAAPRSSGSSSRIAPAARSRSCARADPRWATSRWTSFR